MWHLVGAGAPSSAAGSSMTKCGRLWPAAVGSGQLLPALPGCGRLWPVVERPCLAKLRPDLAVVRPDLARCGRPCTIALVHPSMVYLSIVIPISVYLQVKIPTKLVEPH
jgi:hypothetical protein